MMITRGQFPMFMHEGNVRAAMTNMWDRKKLEEMRGWYYDVKGTKKAFEQSYGMSGLGNAMLKPEGTNYRIDTFTPGRPCTVVFPTYGLGVVISQEAQEDDVDNLLVPKIISELRLAMHEAMEEDAVSVLLNGFTRQGWEPDGEALFSLFHPVLRASSGINSWSNMHPTAAALTGSSLDAAMIALSTTVTDSGRWISAIKPRYLHIAPALLPEARRLLGTDRVLASNNNDINIHRGTLEIKVNPRLGKRSQQWYLAADYHDMKWYNRVAGNIQSEININPGATAFYTRARWGRVAASGRGLYASRGPG